MSATLQSREELIYLLTQAASLEHSICCQYLYAALSLKRDVSEGLTQDQLRLVNDWEQVILMISRQEMEHLGLVCNLLTAIGGAPYLNKPNFPQPPKAYPIWLTLEKFDERTIKRFICIERPEDDPATEEYCREVATPAPETAVQPPAPANSAPTVPQPIHYHTVGELYALIRSGFEYLGATERDLFIGPSTAQVGGMALQYLYPKSIQFMPGVFDVYMAPITDRASAIKAVDLIIEQGEGSSVKPAPDRAPVGSAPTISHYQRFITMLQQYQAAEKAGPFVPARNVVANPRLYLAPDGHGGHRITNSTTRDVLDLFNSVYTTMLLLLMRFFAHTDEDASEIDGLLYTFYPLMTMAVRPLGEILTLLPAGDEGEPERAGPSFETNPDLNLLPHKRSAWLYLHEQLQEQARDALKLSKTPGISDRLPFIAQNLQYIATKFGNLMQLQ